MTRTLGQSSQSILRRENPHQVLVLADSIRGRTFNRVLAFHEPASEFKTVPSEKTTSGTCSTALKSGKMRWHFNRCSAVSYSIVHRLMVPTEAPMKTLKRTPNGNRHNDYYCCVSDTVCNESVEPGKRVQGSIVVQGMACRA